MKFFTIFAFVLLLTGSYAGVGKTMLNMAYKAAKVIVASQEQIISIVKTDETRNVNIKANVDDYKTLSDVLVQEVARWYFLQHESQLGSFVGEENKLFTVGQKEVEVVIKDKLQTKAMLIAFGVNENLADKLTEIIFEDVDYPIAPSEAASFKQLDELEINVQEYGIIMDPIDATNEYEKKRNLHAVQCLIGLFNLKTGLSILGFIAQPFNPLKMNGSTYESITIYWGHAVDGKVGNNIPPLPAIDNDKVVVMMSPKNNVVQDIFPNTFASFTTDSQPGAGYKQLMVVLGHANMYITKGTYVWDTCGPQAILRSLGGDILSYEDYKNGKIVPIQNNRIKGTYINPGVVVVRNTDQALKFISTEISKR